MPVWRCNLERKVGRPVAAARGPANGSSEGKLEGLIAILTARGIALDSTTRERIVCERDPQRLDRWIARAATSTTITEVLADG
jgi:hypothetical protein